MKPRRMKPTKGWGIVDRASGDLAYSPWNLRKYAVKKMQMLHPDDRPAYRIARVRISELPAARRGR